MPVASIGRFILARTLSVPGGLVAILGVLCAWPILFVLAPLGISSSKVLPTGWSFELAILGQALGVLLASSALEVLGPLLAREPRGLRMIREWVVLVMAGLLTAGLAVLPGLSLGAVSLGDSLVGFEAAALPILLTTTAGSMVLARMRLPSGVATWLLGSGILLAPVVVPQPASARSMLLLAASLTFAAWLIDHPPGCAR